MAGELCVRHLSLEEHEIGKRKTQRIERKHLTLRTRIKRLARKTICFSKTQEMHDLVIGRAHKRGWGSTKLVRGIHQRTNNQTSD